MTKTESHKIKVAITQGDINGIGYEVILKTFSDNRMLEHCTPVVYGSTKVASYHKKLLSQQLQDMPANCGIYAVWMVLQHCDIELDLQDGLQGFQLL